MRDPPIHEAVGLVFNVVAMAVMYDRGKRCRDRDLLTHLQEIDEGWDHHYTSSHSAKCSDNSTDTPDDHGHEDVAHGPPGRR